MMRYVKVVSKNDYFAYYFLLKPIKYSFFKF